ncbi:MAG: Clp protease ClpB [Candidatus Parabeggiatoa sp. nov. 3]|jgi:uncharacterized protein (DUF2249 family)|nr:MAG: Clp protease ClpB [Gammaproteobacteria bacterium]RKZ83187.1 MAG: Clp protease ClpB [Gammaproteobacteria bacterium]
MRVLDVSQLEPCEPMERILAALPDLHSGEYLHVLHRMEPYPLYSILTQDGFVWLTQLGDKVPVEIYIWRSTDAEAEAKVRALDDG